LIAVQFKKGLITKLVFQEVYL